MKKLQSYLCPIVFCVFIFVMAVLLLFQPEREYSQREKRYLATAPEWSVEGILDGSAQTDLEAWTADQFPGRDAFMGINTYWTFASGRNALQDVYLCQEDYLINAPVTLNLSTFETNLTRFNGFAASCGVPASMVLVPSAGWLKEDLLPAGHLEYHDDLLFERAGELLTDVTFYDFRQALLAADEVGQVCYRTDHHLTAFGNYTLYDAWMTAKGESALDAADYAIEEVGGFRGTTWSGSGYWLTPAESVELWDSGAEVSVTITDGGKEPIYADSLFFRDHLEELDLYPVYLDGNHCEVGIVNEDAPERTLLIIKDSYAHCFAPFLTEHYETIYLLDLRYYRGEVSTFIEENGVDEVLFFYGAETLLTDTNSAWLR